MKTTKVKVGQCKECGCDLCQPSIRPDGSESIGCSNCSYSIELN